MGVSSSNLGHKTAVVLDFQKMGLFFLITVVLIGASFCDERQLIWRNVPEKSRQTERVNATPNSDGSTCMENNLI